MRNIYFRPAITCSLISVAIVIYIVFNVFFSKEDVSHIRGSHKNMMNSSESTVDDDNIPNPILLGDLKQEDPRLIAEIRRRFIIPPPPPNTPLLLLRPNLEDPSQGQQKIIKNFFNGSRGGFFVEAGGYDGEIFSNTLFLERKLGWRGLLIEADPSLLKSLLEKQRNVWVAPTCVSLTGRASRVFFNANDALGQVVNDTKDKPVIQVQCLPFYSILLAINRTKIDFFSLDVEGAELSVIKTIPWDKLLVKFLTVEYAHVPEGHDAVVDYLVKKGFKIFPDNPVAGQDVMFTRDVW